MHNHHFKKPLTKVSQAEETGKGKMSGCVKGGVGERIIRGEQGGEIESIGPRTEPF